MTGATVFRLAATGTRVDKLRAVLTVLGAALATLFLLCALTVASIGTGDGPYTSDLLNQSGLHQGVILAFVGLCVPVYALLAQCSRIGAPARDRRIAALRMAGATPGQVLRIVGVEAGVTAAVGALVGVGVFFWLRVLLDRPLHGTFERYQISSGSGTQTLTHTALRLPTDVLAPWWTILLAVALAPVLVWVGTALALRRVAFTPFGVLRRVRSRPPRLVPLVLLVVGVIGIFGITPSIRAISSSGTRVSSGAIVAIFLLLLVVLVAGLLSGGGALAQAIGRLVVGRTSHPALLLAARRMISEPFAATRTSAVLTVAVLIAAGAQQLRLIVLASQGGDDAFYAGAFDLVDLVLLIAGLLAAFGLLVAAAEGIVARRRSYAAAVAVGTPRAVIARAVLAELLLPLIPSLLIAAAAGTLAASSIYGRTVDVVETDNVSRTVTVGVPWTFVATIVVGALIASAIITSLSLLLLRRATDIAELRASA